MEQEKQTCMNCHFFCIGSWVERREKVDMGHLNVEEKYCLDKYGETFYGEISREKRSDRLVTADAEIFEAPMPQTTPDDNLLLFSEDCCYFGFWDERVFRLSLKVSRDEKIEEVLAWRNMNHNKKREEDECFYIKHKQGMGFTAAKALQERQWLLRESNKDRELTRQALNKTDKSIAQTENALDKTDQSIAQTDESLRISQGSLETARSSLEVAQGSLSESKTSNRIAIGVMLLTMAVLVINIYFQTKNEPQKVELPTIAIESPVGVDIKSLPVIESEKINQRNE
jgi:hypothetical protein